MNTNNTIGLKIAAYEDLRAQAEELEEQLKGLKQRRDAAEGEVIAAILDAQEQAGVENLRIEWAGRNYSATVKNYYSITKAQKDAAFEEMRALGMGDLIQERVDDRTLTKDLEGALEANGGEMPDAYGPLLEHLSTYTKSALRRVKA